MSYQVLAQKYRPQTFDSVIGQETVTRTLKNAVLKNRIANAYIFCGPRGVGKTSVARLLSKAMNCEQPPEKAPCNKCSSCLEITQGNNIDVLEIDGASNNGVDEIRALRENVKFSPSKSKYKIYIIDEVHMLSQGAFNALLKTLEEPPEHVKFIFATTESHKVLATIMSRCQRFDFKKIPPLRIFEKIMDIAKQEKINIEEKAALLIARSADGSLRDAIVILDQMVSFSGDKITSDDVVELLGMVRKDKMFDLSNAINEKDPAKVARILDEMINSGKDPVFIVNSLIMHYRELMVLKTAGDPTTDMALTEDELSELRSQAGKLSIEEVLYILQSLAHCLTLMKGAMFARAPLEVALIRLARRASMLPLTEVLEKLEKAEGKIVSAPKEAPASFIPSKNKEEVIIKKEELSIKSHPPESAPISNEIQDDVLENGENGSAEETLKTPEESWKAILNYVRKKKMSVFVFLSPAKPIELSTSKAVIGFGPEYSFNKEALESANNKSIVEEAVNKVTGASPRVKFTLLEEGDKSLDKKDLSAGKKTKAREEMKPVVEKAMDVFGGHVVRDLTEDTR